jgi:TorA maturation chaperone TorD
VNHNRSSQSTIAEVGKVNLTRAAVYSFLSRAFKLEVDERFLRDIVEIQPTVGMLSESQGGSELKEGSTLLNEFAEQSKDLKGEKKEGLLTDLAAEYASLFLNMGPKPVRLVESVYLGKDHLLYEKPYHEIVQAYKSLSYQKEKGFQEPEDHVAVEFDFMAHLCRWTSRTLDEGDVEKAVAYLNLQKEFLRDHLNLWIPNLCEELEKTASSSLYKGLAQVTRGFVALDDGIPDHLTETLKKPN